MNTHKITFKLVRSFGIGFTIYSPTLNGICFEIDLACFSMTIWGKGEELIGFESYWERE